ncbi:MAG TPA: acyl-CoA dehydrogenase family protein [Candidatus Baltobacteraceae bacterium]|jgi:putative acyl-CoA dehydrogenase|nr:acyl-CoA dehydrogenase family protein [Candidatus Baltobacteraceae bacterium]
MASQQVVNQPPPLESYNLFSTDRALCEGLEREAPGGDVSEVRTVGERAGAPDVIALGFDANTNPPELRTHDRFGNRIDEVHYHPAYHVLMAISTGYGLHGSPWIENIAFQHVTRAAKFFLMSQVDSGHGCPISMTYAALPALARNPELSRVLAPHVGARAYDPRLLPLGEKPGMLFGMGMTEKQGGSDVRANRTRAVPASNARGNGAEYVLDGHKWFCSAPMSDAFLVLAQADGGLSCFYLPRVLPDGSRNPFFLQRLKSKLGNHSNASSEVEFAGTHAWLLGDEGRGIATIVDMVNSTRLDCITGSAGLMRQAVAQAIHHAAYRQTFGRTLVQHPLMQNVLADLALESEAATALFLRAARATDDWASGRRDGALRRVGTAIGKFYVCKRAPAVVAEALECLGGNGYVEESVMPRLYREAPLNSIWEGSGNINALDVLRIIRKAPEAIDALRTEIAPALGDRHMLAAANDLERDLGSEDDREWQARSLVERMALLWQAALLVQHAPNYVADAFIESRIAGKWGRAMGTLMNKRAFRGIIERAAPQEYEVPIIQ